MWFPRKRTRSSSTAASTSRPTLLQVQFLFVFVTVWVICITVSLTRRAECRENSRSDSLWVTLQKQAPEAFAGGPASGRHLYPPDGGSLVKILHLYRYTNNTTTTKASQHDTNYHENSITQHENQSISRLNEIPNRKLLELDSLSATSGVGPLGNITTGLIQRENLPLCDQFPGTLVGLLRLPTSTSEWSMLLRGHRSIVPGGHWSPTKCVSRQRIAIVVPYQDRPHHLRTFLLYMHPFLQRQQVDYTIYIVEQIYPETFNRAAVLNAGFLEVTKSSPYDCIIFHDVDLLPEHDHNKYECGQYPRHLAAYVNTTNYRLNENNVGGVLAMTPDKVRLVNGFSTTFWGWGGEDDDMFMRISRHQHLRIERPSSTVGRYKMLPHGRDARNPLNPNRMRGATYRGTRYSTDGLNSIKYDVLSTKQNELFTHITISLEPPDS